MSRAVFILVTGFWITMNVLLWQTEFGSRKSGGSVPVRVVWEKILTAADDSSLTVLRNERLVGAIHIQTQVGEAWSQIGDDNMPSSGPLKGAGYRLAMDGNVIMPEITNRFRFEGSLNLDRNREWQEVEIHFAQRPFTWQIHSIAGEKTIHVNLQGGESPFDVVLGFSDLKNPAALTYKLLGESAADFATEAGLASTAVGNASAIGLGVNWDAHEDSLRVGRTPVQVYRLHTRLMDQYDINILVSRAGEILQADFPGGYRLVNDRMVESGISPGWRAQGKSPASRR